MLKNKVHDELRELTKVELHSHSQFIYKLSTKHNFKIIIIIIIIRAGDSIFVYIKMSFYKLPSISHVVQIPLKVFFSSLIFTLKSLNLIFILLF